MLTDSQKRALRAKTLLDMGGVNPREVARQCGYSSVNGMLGAIAMCDGIQTPAPTAKPAAKPVVKIYPVEDGTIWIQKEDIAVSYRPDGKVGPTVYINDELYKRRTGHPKWLAIVGKDTGSKAVIAGMLRQIAEAVSECAALIEDEIKGGK